MIIGIIIEKKYVSRIAMFTNASALYIFYQSLNMSLILGIIVNSIIVIVLIGGISRFMKSSLPAQFYKVGWVASSAATAILLIYGLTL